MSQVLCAFMAFSNSWKSFLYTYNTTCSSSCQVWCIHSAAVEPLKIPELLARVQLSMMFYLYIYGSAIVPTVWWYRHELTVTRVQHFRKCKDFVINSLPLVLGSWRETNRGYSYEEHSVRPTLILESVVQPPHYGQFLRPQCVLYRNQKIKKRACVLMLSALLVSKGSQLGKLWLLCRNLILLSCTFSRTILENILLLCYHGCRLFLPSEY